VVVPAVDIAVAGIEVAPAIASTAAEAIVEAVAGRNHPVVVKIAYRNSSKTAGLDSFVRRTAGTEIPATLLAPLVPDDITGKNYTPS
jgi:hypothetical protein